MNDLVIVKRKEIWVESNVVARKVEIPHHYFMRTVRTVIEKLQTVKLKKDETIPAYKLENRTYRGQTFEICLMSKEFFSLVIMRFETPQAFEWQVRFNNAFYAMEKALLKVNTNKADIEWTSSRVIGKSARKEETDAIKQFVEYAVGQGSTKAQHYYSTLTNSTYRCLGFMAKQHPKLREEMGIYELSMLLLAEKLVADRLKYYMKVGRHYKDIYQSVKDDLISFAESVRPLQLTSVS